MKKIFIYLSLIVCSSLAKSQNLDTVLIRSGITLQSQDWAVIIGSYGDIYPDSATAAEARRIRLEIKTANPATWTTNVTVDSIKGTFAMAFYKIIKTMNAGQIAARYTAITSAIEAVPVLSSFITAFNNIMLADFNRRRDRGKTIVMDN